MHILKVETDFGKLVFHMPISLEDEDENEEECKIFAELLVGAILKYPREQGFLVYIENTKTGYKHTVKY
jgi:hypothetical protein